MDSKAVRASEPLDGMRTVAAPSCGRAGSGLLGLVGTLLPIRHDSLNTIMIDGRSVMHDKPALPWIRLDGNPAYPLAATIVGIWRAANVR